MKFLLICEQALIRDGFCNLLRSLEIGDGLAVYDTDQVESAKGIVSEARTIDLIIYYLSLDDRGWSGLAEITRLVVDAPVIVVGDFKSDFDLRKAIQRGANGCVSTDFTWRVVASIIERVLQGEIVSPSVKGKNQDIDTRRAAVDTGGVGYGSVRPMAAASQLGQKLSQLTPRQLEVLNLIKLGKSNKEIARSLDVAEGTVKIHCAAIFRELGVTNRTQAALLAEEIAVR